MDSTTKGRKKSGKLRLKRERLRTITFVVRRPALAAKGIALLMRTTVPVAYCTQNPDDCMVANSIMSCFPGNCDTLLSDVMCIDNIKPAPAGGRGGGGRGGRGGGGRGGKRGGPAAKR
jgi:hypothetical protein